MKNPDWDGRMKVQALKPKYPKAAYFDALADVSQLRQNLAASQERERALVEVLVSLLHEATMCTMTFETRRDGRPEVCLHYAKEQWDQVQAARHIAFDLLDARKGER